MDENGKIRRRLIKGAAAAGGLFAVNSILSQFSNSPRPVLKENEVQVPPKPLSDDPNFLDDTSSVEHHVSRISPITKKYLERLKISDKTNRSLQDTEIQDFNSKIVSSLVRLTRARLSKTEILRSEKDIVRFSKLVFAVCEKESNFRYDFTKNLVRDPVLGWTLPFPVGVSDSTFGKTLGIGQISESTYSDTLEYYDLERTLDGTTVRDILLSENKQKAIDAMVLTVLYHADKVIELYRVEPYTEEFFKIFYTAYNTGVFAPRRAFMQLSAYSSLESSNPTELLEIFKNYPGFISEDAINLFEGRISRNEPNPFTSSPEIVLDSFLSDIDIDILTLLIFKNKDLAQSYGIIIDVFTKEKIREKIIEDYFIEVGEINGVKTYQIDPDINIKIDELFAFQRQVLAEQELNINPDIDYSLNGMSAIPFIKTDQNSEEKNMPEEVQRYLSSNSRESLNQFLSILERM